ncbi:MAG: permease of the major facilitator superfamily [Phenylobacterium sp.]|uniref:MFS transporter n=1 Tax=Phenylobacterium sp. TaxID=1871053 RepID=UPI00261C8405|nr:MFS transporter [Phenylobacterium sp.]MDB5499383.1 permease of the major facilitator superfamily [Phenylobacterium sp.]
MADIAADGIEAPAKRVGLRTVVAASAAGTTFEWYDFFVFGSLTQVISKTFFSGLNETAGYIAALALFGAGFAFRPIGALVFGRIGDRVGRKGAFLVTVVLMGGATVLIGVLPSYAAAGVISPILLLLMRIVQGFALGGEYGGAAIYVAEHAPPDARGRSTSWVQTSAAFGLFAALLVILVTRLALGKAFGPAAFDAWGWRIPFLFSAGLLAVSIYMRLKLSESPAFAAMKAEGGGSAAPYAEAFGQWKNLKTVLLALVAIMFAQGAVWYTAFFYVQTFMEKFLKVDPPIINGLMMAATAVSAVGYVVFGWLSDKIGRKPVMLFGMTLMLAAYFPGFHMLARTLNPALAEATARSPATVIADPADCALQFDPVGKAAFTSSCDIAKSALANAGVSYVNQAGAPGQPAMVRVGMATIPSLDARGLPKDVAKAVKASVEGKIKEGLARAGYPAKADPKRMNLPGAFAVMLVFVIAATALFGPIAACLVELFPTRIRYTAMSLPYHIGTGWVGGFVPFTAFAIVAAVGNIYSGLWYPFAFTAISVVTCLLLVPETKGRSLNS